MFVVRHARQSDLSEIERLAELLDSVNLPADASQLRDVIGISEASFAGTVPAAARSYLFVLIDEASDRVCGVSMIIAAHGTPDDPHHYYRLDVDERYSRTLDRMFRHRTMRLRLEYTPHTEIGALVLDPAIRGRPERLGKLLSFARFLFVAAHRDVFCDSVQAELLPPFEADGTSRLWNWLGHRFTGLSYRDADRLSRTDTEFIKALFPTDPIYISLMPEDVRDVIGAVGARTAGVAAMLRSIGFAFNRHIDPFDGGPHFEARLDDVSIVSSAVRGAFAGVAEPPSELGLAGVFGSEFGAARIVRAGFDVAASGDGVVPAVRLDAGSATALQVTDGDVVWVAPMPQRSGGCP